MSTPRDDMDPTDGQPIARYYLAEQNPDGAHIVGVPLRNLTEAEFGRYPEYIKQSIDALPFYATRPPRLQKE